jgi:signal transduction histidine kinase
MEIVLRRSAPHMRDGQLLETLADVNLSCVAAVDILNDLLTFEKLEGGMMDLHKESISPDLLVRSSMQIFLLQAKSKDITLELVTSASPSGDSRLAETCSVEGSGGPDGLVEKALGLVEGDMVSCDRFKVSGWMSEGGG